MHRLLCKNQQTESKRDSEFTMTEETAVLNKVQQCMQVYYLFTVWSIYYKKCHKWIPDIHYHVMFRLKSMFKIIENSNTGPTCLFYALYINKYILNKLAGSFLFVQYIQYDSAWSADVTDIFIMFSLQRILTLSVGWRRCWWDCWSMAHLHMKASCNFVLLWHLYIDKYTVSPHSDSFGR